MRPGAGEVLHFSEDPTIRRFVPHVAATARRPEAYVWAVDAANAPSYWFPRQCPRAMAWVCDSTTAADRSAILGPVADRVHLIEYDWLDRVRSAQIFAYRFDAGEFQPFGEPGAPHAFVATHPVEPLGAPEPIGDVLALHRDAGIELRLATRIWPWWRTVVAATVGFSGIRLRNAAGSPDD